MAIHACNWWFLSFFAPVFPCLLSICVICFVFRLWKWSLCTFSSPPPTCQPCFALNDGIRTKSGNSQRDNDHWWPFSSGWRKITATPLSWPALVNPLFSYMALEFWFFDHTQIGKHGKGIGVHQKGSFCRSSHTMQQGWSVCAMSLYKLVMIRRQTHAYSPFQNVAH